METRSIRAIRRINGSVTAQILVYLHTDKEQVAYDIHNDRDSDGMSHYWYEADGKRRDLKPHEVKALMKAVREVLS